MDDMTREELEEELRKLRAALERTAVEVPSVDADDPDSWATFPKDRDTTSNESLPLDEWVSMDSVEDFTRDARQHLDDLELSRRLSFTQIESGDHGSLFEILVDGEPSGNSIRFSGTPVEADMRLHAARRLRKIGMVPEEKSLECERLQLYLSDLARLGARYAVELVPDMQHGGVRLKPIAGQQGGYLAERVDAGHLVLRSYDHGASPEVSPADVVGDDFHPEARAERARLWKVENAEAIAEQAARALSVDDPFARAFRNARGLWPKPLDAPDGGDDA
jgi:hypothetical protein